MSQLAARACAALLCAAPLAAQVAALPYAEHFESPTWPGPEWANAVTGVNGRILTVVPSTLSPAGGACLAMDVSVSNSFSTNTSTLTVDLSSAMGATLRYWGRDQSDEAHVEDGLFINDGSAAPFVKVVDHATLTGTWQEITVDLFAAAATAGFAPTANFKVRWSWRDNNPIPTDGVQFDGVRIDPPLGQSNGPLASLVLSGAVNVFGQTGAASSAGPFTLTAAPGTPFTMTISGEPNRIYALLAGPLNPFNWVIPGVGSLDLGLNGPSNLGDVVFILDGGQPGGFNAFANTGPSGTSLWNLAVPIAPPGVFTTLQAAVLTGSSTLKLSAAVQIVVL
ncbi:MAG TPA: hypothetical protein VEI02_02310 [Planctomycetota bacterium]|nr:hypothetical protein [Planctomycetota bacterium]